MKFYLGKVALLYILFPMAASGRGRFAYPEPSASLRDLKHDTRYEFSYETLTDREALLSIYPIATRRFPPKLLRVLTGCNMR